MPECWQCCLVKPVGESTATLRGRFPTALPKSAGSLRTVTPAGRVGLVARIVGDGFMVEPKEPIP